MDSKNFAIGVLSTTAVILLSALILLHQLPQPTLASGMGDRGGDYILLSGEMWEQEEILYVIDTNLDKMITYRYDLGRGQLEVGSVGNLKDALRGPDPSVAPKGAGKKPKP